MSRARIPHIAWAAFALKSLMLLAPAVVFARLPSDAPALPKPTGRVVTVGDVNSLYNAVAALQSNTTIVLRKGTYQLTRPVNIAAALTNVALCGETGNYNDVVLKGAGMRNLAVYHGVMADRVNGLLIADMTIGWVGYHPISLNPNQLRNVHIYHCRLVDAGEQFIKVSFKDAATAIHSGIVEYCVMEYTTFGPNDGYTNGVDVLGGRDWIIRHNLFRNIRTQTGPSAGPAVLCWQGAANTRCEQNTFLNCDRAISFGLVDAATGHDHTGGVVANNFISVNKAQVPHSDVGIYVGDSPGTKVWHNTVWNERAYPNAIEVRFPGSTGVMVQNNLSDSRVTLRDGATATITGNQATATAAMFRSVATGDLHLAATAKVPTVPPLLGCANDFDSALRPPVATTIGADDPTAAAAK
ncbi:MAG: hypothetical protein K8T25_06005 [Planctomycetia bacterium]|nr:hypothetical protein [Planctomycetia bacterium]